MKLLFLTLLLSGCVTGNVHAVHPTNAREFALTDQQCRSLNTQRILWGALGAGASFAAGAQGGLDPLIIDPTQKYAIGIAAVVTGISGAIFTYVSTQEINTFNQFCLTNR